VPQEIDLFAGSNAPFSVWGLVLNLLIGVVLSLILRWHFVRFGSTLSNREELGQVLPFILLTTVLIITVVKSSLALSLGLVGALSIVRFRTPIKEPEELAYLFIAIALGLGLGANQVVATVVAGLLILAVMTVIKYYGQDDSRKNLYLSVQWQTDDGTSPDSRLNDLHEVIGRHVQSSDLRRFDAGPNSLEVTYLLDIKSTAGLNDLAQDLRSSFPSIGVTFLDQSGMPGV